MSLGEDARIFWVTCVDLHIKKQISYKDDFIILIFVCQYVLETVDFVCLSAKKYIVIQTVGNTSTSGNF